MDDLADSGKTPAGFWKRFPALERLRLAVGGSPIPYVQQMAVSDCGAACLCMSLGYFGKTVPLNEAREVSGAHRDGTDALSILRAARYYGLRGRLQKVKELDDLQYLRPATILHWEFNHFVVFERATRRGLHIADPAVGRRAVPWDYVGKAFTGVALTFEPTSDFVPSRSRQKGVWAYLGHLIRQPSILLRVAILSLLLQLFTLAVPLLTGTIVDRIVPRGDSRLLLVVTLSLGLILLFTFLTSLVRSHLLLHLQTHLDLSTTLNFLEHLVDLPYSYFQTRSPGDLITRINSNEAIRQILTSGAVSALLDGCLVFLYLVLLLATSPSMGLLILGIGLLQMSVLFLAGKRTRELTSQGLQVRAKSQSFLMQIFFGIETLKTSGVELRSAQTWSNLYVDELNMALARGRIQALVDGVVTTVKVGAPLTILAVGAYQVLANQLSLGTMLALSALGSGFLLPLSALVTTGLEIQKLKGYVERIDDVLEAPVEQDRRKVALAPRLRGRIKLEHVSFRYGPTSPMVLRDINVEIKPHQFVGVVGKSGAGKSTLMGLLLGLYEPTSGTISYDGQNLLETDFRSLRGQIGVVPQHPFLFEGSIRENISLHDPLAKLDAIVYAAKLAGIHEDIVSMTMGYETLITAGGISLSGGQRQRLALARALLRKPAVLLLDEATSALDKLTESQIQENLERLRYTKIVIAHRLSTVRFADLILVLDGGEIVEQGTHAELTEKAGVYARLLRGTEV